LLATWRLGGEAAAVAGEVSVVAEPDQALPAGGVHVSTGELGRVQGGGQRVREEPADRDRAAPGVADPPQLGIAAEPRAGRVDRGQLRGQLRGQHVVRRDQRVRVGDQQGREGTQRREGPGAERRRAVAEGLAAGAARARFRGAWPGEGVAGGGVVAARAVVLSPAAVWAGAVRANRVARPTAVTALSWVARQVSRERRRSPAVRAASGGCGPENSALLRMTRDHSRSRVKGS